MFKDGKKGHFSRDSGDFSLQSDPPQRAIFLIAGGCGLFLGFGSPWGWLGGKPLDSKKKDLKLLVGARNTSFFHRWMPIRVG